MFGTFRLALALMVVWYHLVDWDFSGPAAVFGFYCLSGYLMTKVINEVYGDGLPGFVRFLGNRALRIYPIYYAALAVSAVVLALWPTASADISEYYVWPADLLPQLTIIGIMPETDRFLPPAWSLHVELIFYLAIGALLGRSRLATTLWFVLSAEVPVLVWLFYGKQFEFVWYYCSLPGSSVAFAAGAMIYHYRDRLQRLPLWTGAVAAAATIIFGMTCPRALVEASGLYISLLLSAVAIAGLRTWPQRKWDGRLGDLAYPVFLLHYPSAGLAFGLLGRSATTTALAVALTILLSLAAADLIERPLRNVRTILRAPAARFGVPR